MSFASVARFAPRALVLVALSVLAAALASQPEPVERLVTRLRDLPATFGTERAVFDGTLIADMASPEHATEAERAGLVPYRREIHGEVVRWLSAAGARSIAFNLVFEDAQPDDEAFANRLTRSVVLGATGARVFARGEEPRAAAAVESLPTVPGSAIHSAIEWPGFALPVAPLLQPQRARVGVIHYEADADGRVRRQPLLHAGGGHLLPALPLAIIAADGGPSGRIEERDGRLRLGLLAWPIDDRGQVLLRFPQNVRDLPVVSYHRIALAATGIRPDPDLERQVRGRVVFVGNGSPGAGFVAQTPVGPLPGLHLTALGHALLVAGEVVLPARPAWDVPLTLATLLPGLALLWRRRSVPQVVALAAAPVGIGVAAGMGLAFLGIASHWPFAILAGVAAVTITAAWQAFTAETIARQKRQERVAAEDANRLKTEFLNHLTHELRTPLTAIMGFNKINQFTDELGKDQRIANSAVIARNCEHLLALINNNLDLAKMEAGQLAIVRSPEEPEQIFRDVIATMRALAADKSIELRYVKRTRLPEGLLLDAFRLRQVLINLMGNAVKFTSRGSVELSVAWHIAALEIEVRDTGPGIAPEALERIWQPFKQADLTVGRRFGGTGLGLAISRRLVELMGGEIGVESRVGVGTTFRVRVPTEAVARRPQADAATGAAATQPPAPQRDRLSGRVLLADDNEDLRALVTLLLTNLGLSVKSVENGLLAVESAVAEEVDVLLMDMEMPVMNGYEAVHVLRTRGYTGTIFGLTAHQDGPEVARAILSGCDAVLTKPISLDSLKAALAPVLERRRSTNVPPRGTLRAANNG